MGQLRVAHQETNAPLNRVLREGYARVKVVRGHAFYKDGYTAVRGRSTTPRRTASDAVDRLALLVRAEENGAVIREAGTSQEVSGRPLTRSSQKTGVEPHHGPTSCRSGDYEVLGELARGAMWSRPGGARAGRRSSRLKVVLKATRRPSTGRHASGGSSRS